MLLFIRKVTRAAGPTQERFRSQFRPRYSIDKWSLIKAAQKQPADYHLLTYSISLLLGQYRFCLTFHSLTGCGWWRLFRELKPLWDLAELSHCEHTHTYFSTSVREYFHRSINNLWQFFFFVQHSRRNDRTDLVQCVRSSSECRWHQTVFIYE